MALVEPEAGLTLLHLICSMGKLKIGQHMLNSGFPIAQEAKDGRLPIHFLLERGLDLVSPTTTPDEIELFTCSLVDGISPNHTLPEDEDDPKGGYSLLHFAVERGEFALIKLLQSRGANLGAKEGTGVGVLEVAIKHEDEEVALEMVEFLLGKSMRDEVEGVGEKLLKIGLDFFFFFFFFFFFPLLFLTFFFFFF